VRKIIGIALAVLAINAFAAGTWTANRSQRRAKEVAAVNGSIKIKASGVLNTTVELYDANNIANAGFDYDLIEGHRDALRDLGFTAVHIETATGQKLDRPL
jgi:hypothetical protein